jgi:hypothetical protein
MARRGAARLLLGLPAAAPPGGCGGEPAHPAASAPADTTRLTVRVTGAGPDPVTIELRCGGAKPCDRAQLDKLAAVAEPADPTLACTQQYGGPEEARMTGTLEGRPVDVTVDRTNGCGIADYDALFAALGSKPIVAG